MVMMSRTPVMGRMAAATAEVVGPMRTWGLSARVSILLTTVAVAPTVVPVSNIETARRDCRRPPAQRSPEWARTRHCAR